MIIQDGHFLVHHYGFEKIGWLGSTTLSPLPDGDWITRRELAASYGLEVSLEGDGIQLRHPDGTSIRFSGVAQGYEAVCQDKTLRMIIQDSGTMVDRTGLREIGWLDETRPAPQPGPTSEPESVPDGDWISVRQWAESAGLGINLSGDGDTIRLQVPGSPTISFTRVGRVYEAVHQGTTLRISIQDGSTMIDRRGLQEIGWL